MTLLTILVISNLFLFVTLTLAGFPSHQVPDYWEIPKPEPELKEQSFFQEIFFFLFSLFGLIFYLAYLAWKNYQIDTEFKEIKKQALNENSTVFFNVGASVFLPQKDGSNKICEIMNVITVKENNQTVNIYQILAYDPDFQLNQKFWTANQLKKITT